MIVFASPNWECADYLKAKGQTSEAVALTQSILDARLAITRLRQAHPSPRLTIPVAEERLSSQVVEMQMLEDESQRVNEEIARVKDAIKGATAEMDRLRSEKAELEKKVAMHKVEADDGRAVELCDWCVVLACLRAFELSRAHAGTHRLWHFNEPTLICNLRDMFRRMSWCFHMQSTPRTTLRRQKFNVLSRLSSFFSPIRGSWRMFVLRVWTR